MSPFLIGAIYLTVWFIMLFILLPIGLVQEDEPIPGQVLSAPKHLGLRWKLWTNTVVSGVITCAIVWLMVQG